MFASLALPAASNTVSVTSETAGSTLTDLATTRCRYRPPLKPSQPERCTDMARPGRPEVGQPINVRLGDDLLARVDARASTDGVSRAEIIRRLVSAGV